MDPTNPSRPGPVGPTKAKATSQSKAENAKAEKAKLDAQLQQAKDFAMQRGVKGKELKAFLQARRTVAARRSNEDVLKMVRKNTTVASAPGGKRQKKEAPERRKEITTIDYLPTVNWNGTPRTSPSGTLSLPHIEANVPVNWVYQQVEKINTLATPVIKDEVGRTQHPKLVHPILGTIRTIHTVAATGTVMRALTEAVSSWMPGDDPVRLWLLIPSLNPRTLYYHISFVLRAFAPYQVRVRDGMPKVTVYMYHPFKIGKFSQRYYQTNADLFNWVEVECMDGDQLVPPNPYVTDLVWDFGWYLVRPSDIKTDTFFASYVSIPSKSTGGTVGTGIPEVVAKRTGDNLVVFSYDDDAEFATGWYLNSASGLHYDLKLVASISCWALAFYHVRRSHDPKAHPGAYIRVKYHGKIATLTPDRFVVEKVQLDPSAEDPVLGSLKQELRKPDPTDPFLGLEETPPRLSNSPGASQIAGPIDPPTPSPAAQMTKRDEKSASRHEAQKLKFTDPVRTPRAAPILHDEIEDAERAAKQLRRPPREPLRGERLMEALEAEEETEQARTWFSWLFKPASWFSFYATRPPRPPDNSARGVVVDTYMRSTSSPIVDRTTHASRLNGVARTLSIPVARVADIVGTYVPAIANHYVMMEDQLSELDRQTFFSRNRNWIVGAGVLAACAYFKRGNILQYLHPAAGFSGPYGPNFSRFFVEVVLSPFVEEVVRATATCFGLPDWATCAFFAHQDATHNPAANFFVQFAIHYFFAKVGWSFHSRLMLHMTFNALVGGHVATFLVPLMAAIRDQTALGQWLTNLRPPGENFATIPDAPAQAFDRITEVMHPANGGISKFVMDYLLTNPIFVPVVTKAANSDRELVFRGDGYWVNKRLALITPFVDNLVPAKCPWVRIAPACPAGRVLPPLMPGNTVRTEHYTPACNAVNGDAYGPLFRVLGIEGRRPIVWTFANCHHALGLAMTARMAGVPPRYVGVQNPGNERNTIVNNWRLLTRWTSLLDREDDVVEKKEPVMQTDQEWLAKYPAKVAYDINYQSELQGDALEKSYQAMVKVEKNTGFASWFNGNRLLEPKDPRGIFIPRYAKRMAMGPECSFASDTLKAAKTGRFFYTCGTTETERATWFQWALQQSSPCFAYCGDNMLITFRNNVFCCDMKRMDMHVHGGSQESVVKWMCHIKCHRAAGIIVNDMVKEVRCRAGTVVFKVRVHMTQPSGRGDTTVSNSATVHMILDYFDRIFDMNWDAQRIRLELIRVCELLGFVIEVNVVDFTQSPLNVEFLQQRFWKVDHPVLDRVPGNRIGRILIRTFWTRDHLNEEQYLGLMKGIAGSLVKQNMHVPIINTLLCTILEHTRHTKAYYDRDWRAKLRQGFVNPNFAVIYKEHPDSKAELALTLGVDLQEVLALDQEVRKVRLGVGICGDESFRKILDALIAWDL